MLFFIVDGNYIVLGYSLISIFHSPRYSQRKQTMKISMAILITAIGIFFPTSVLLAEQTADYGKTEYESNCASCHGLVGKGDGPLSRIYLSKRTDLTTLAKRNDGVFPVQRVYEIIDGRQEVEEHGPRTMPVWGKVYRSKAPDLPNTGLGYYNLRGTIANVKIISLVDFLQQLQRSDQ